MNDPEDLASGEEEDPGRAERDEWLASQHPDTLELVQNCDHMMSVFAAQRYECIYSLHREWLTDARKHGAEGDGAEGDGVETHGVETHGVETHGVETHGAETHGAETHGVDLKDVLERSLRLELATALSITDGAAEVLLREAEALVERYPDVLESLSRARMTQRHATMIVEALDAVEPELRDALAADALRLAEALPLRTFRRRLRHLVDSARVVTLAERQAEAARDRRVYVEAAEDGMSWLHALLPSVETHAIFDRLSKTATVIVRTEGEVRTTAQVRADVLGDLLIDGTTDLLPPELRGIRPTVFVTVPALAVIGVEGAGDAFATVNGVGPIPIDQARTLCAGSDEWMRILTHPETGMVLSVGRDRYRPPPSLRRMVQWRAATCMAPGCSIPANRCEIDHNIAFEHGGVTSAANLCPLCTGHHHVKHHGGWSIEQPPDGGGMIRWTSPSGRRYDVKAERRVPAFVPADAGTAPF